MDEVVPRECGAVEPAGLTVPETTHREGVVQGGGGRQVVGPFAFGSCSAYPDGEQPPSPELLPVCPAFEYEGVISDDVSVDLPYDYTLLLENVMDISHVPYTHHGTQGKREFARPINYTVTEALTQAGFKLESQMQARIPAASSDKDAVQSNVGKGEKRDADIKKKGPPKFYDVNDNAPYEEDRHFLIKKISSLDNKQLKGILPIVKDY